MAKFYAAPPTRFGDVKIPLRKILANLPNDFHVCLEFKVSSRDFDLVIVHSKGIHVIEVKNDARPIHGGRTWPKWNVINDHGDTVYEHGNPYNQVETLARELQIFLRRASGKI